MKEANLYDTKYITFWKMHVETVKRSVVASDWVGWGGGEQVEEHRGLEGKETTLCDTVMAGTCHYTGTSSTLTE